MCCCSVDKCGGGGEVAMSLVSDVAVGGMVDSDVSVSE